MIDPVDLHQADLPKDQADLQEDAEYWQLVSDLMDLRRATAEALGSHDACDALDEKLPGDPRESMQPALEGFAPLDDELRARVVAAAGLVS